MWGQFSIKNSNVFRERIVGYSIKLELCAMCPPINMSQHEHRLIGECEITWPLLLAKVKKCDITTADYNIITLIKCKWHFTTDFTTKAAQDQ